jgi:hypothetical protein
MHKLGLVFFIYVLYIAYHNNKCADIFATLIFQKLSYYEMYTRSQSYRQYSDAPIV